MNTAYVLYNKPIKVVNLEGIIYYQSRRESWFWNRKYYETHNMALMLIEILYQRNQINEPTYRKIMNKNYIQNRIA